ncbi:MAG TPA: FGGY-family carbohydrate kinase [Terracidiphilus sp.]|nr:FGGY-family carbohydrate kinase [Terracidiphilus sp.]
MGIDIGTSGPKAAVFSLDGDQISVASMGLSGGQGAVGGELRSEDLWEAIKLVVQKAVSEAGHSPIKAVSISSQGETFVPVDRQGSPLTPLVTNVNSTANREADELATAIGQKQMYETTGLPSHGMYTLPKILALRKEHPVIYADSVRFLCIEDYILSRVGIGAYISYSLASRTYGFDVSKRTWSETILSHCGLDPSHLAIPVASGTPLGTANASIAEELGLPKEAIWVAGGHDQGCCSIAARGKSSQTTAVDGTGTFECLTFSGKCGPESVVGPIFPIEADLTPEHYLTLAYVPGGIVPRWMSEQILGIDPKAAPNYDSILNFVDDEPTGIFVFPYLFGTGTPWLDSEAKGAIVGLTNNTTSHSIFRAGLEGITFELKWNIEMLGNQLHSIHSVGGGSRSRVWLQLKADIFGQPVTSFKGETSCAGAAICAAMGIGAFSTWDEAAVAFLRPSGTFTPRKRISEAYQSAFCRYKEIATQIFEFRFRTNL